MTSGDGNDFAYLLESVEGGKNLARFSIIGSKPFYILKTGPSCELKGDPLIHLEAEMAKYRAIEFPSLQLPPFSGGAVGYVGYDCVRYFEPKTEKFIAAQRDVMGIPDSLFMLCDTIVVFDHVRHSVKVVSHCRLDTGNLASAYAAASARVAAVVECLSRPLPVSLKKIFSSPRRPDAMPATETRSCGSNASGAKTSEHDSNVGKEGYERFVKTLKEHIVDGDIIQAVPSQRIAVPLSAATTPFNLYRRLRTINPSPYMFFLQLGADTQIVGASPEMLCKVQDGLVTTHPIAGTRRRGASAKEDAALAKELLADEKERAEHIMLVDLGRNDVGRVAKPGTVQVPKLMEIVKYSHVMHIVSVVTGQLRDDKTVYDAFRSIFPAGTVSGAPKVRAMQLVAGLEHERRHIYAGSVGYVSFSGVMDTAIAIRTMVINKGIVYLQAGGGIVYDSQPHDEYVETMNKLAATIRAVEQAGKTTAPGIPKVADPPQKKQRV